MNKKVLVMRFSALGDVAMTIPIIYSFAAASPQTEITVLSRKQFAGLYAHAPANVHFMGVELEQYKGFAGLWRLYRTLKQQGFDAVADLHNVLRTKVLRLFFRFSGTPCAHIHKGRGEKKALTREHNKKLRQLDTSFSRYHKVFQKLGYEFPLTFHSLFTQPPQNEEAIAHFIGENQKGECKWVGVAPFAKHQGKIYPLELMEEVVRLLSNDERLRIFLFGGGKEETNILGQWANKYERVWSCAGCFSFDEELALMSRLDVMLSMDSGNMHLASLVGTPVISIWGATHPYAGFMGWNQPGKNALQVNMPCRPCSVYGDKPCLRGDYACLNAIRPYQVVEALLPYTNK